ncbi:FKBP-type peptidyl-prolyl cis-trans isomerase FklB [Chitinophaga skermanii]|uniref:Peptidyl-prolyl cis-trans isomerase n=1 Tax=Chitinophaga skermanii TaxID=331697 RepID=A0A327Q7K2_9BACT|nr:FKBP-type peptidyl-prolyl cis-trans isomerase [Chitinophaga skermanii]RAJ00281.1 FKBP-type peptidyl-prolyl cis-trans isomerase FklB [Chitinophaga skermanii]
MIGKFLFIGALAAITIPATAQKKAAPAKKVAATPLKSAVDSASYAIGLDIASNLAENGMDGLNNAMIIQAMQDTWSKKNVLLSKEQGAMSITQYLQQLKAEKAAKAKAEADAFLNTNKTKPGVVTLPSGLQYTIITEGTGPRPTVNDRVKTHYTGMLLDGTKFDSSVDRGEPVTFPVTGVIKGWTEALQLMPVGSKWKLFIPADLAYGDRGAGGKIKPGATLIFDVELLEIVK